MSQEPRQAVRALEREIEERLASARAARTVVDDATEQAADVRTRAREHAAHAAEQRTQQLMSAARERGQALRADAQRRAEQLEASALARRGEDVAGVLGAVLPQSTTGEQSVPGHEGWEG